MVRISRRRTWCWLNGEQERGVGGIGSRQVKVSIGEIERMQQNIPEYPCYRSIGSMLLRVDDDYTFVSHTSTCNSLAGVLDLEQSAQSESLISYGERKSTHLPDLLAHQSRLANPLALLLPIPSLPPRYKKLA